jgi:hypothetical protein
MEYITNWAIKKLTKEEQEVLKELDKKYEYKFNELLTNHINEEKKQKTNNTQR